MLARHWYTAWAEEKIVEKEKAEPMALPGADSTPPGITMDGCLDKCLLCVF